jgi:hypothetical protein
MGRVLLLNILMTILVFSVFLVRKPLLLVGIGGEEVLDFLVPWATAVHQEHFSFAPGLTVFFIAVSEAHENAPKT